MDEAVLYSCAGELNPGARIQATSLGLFSKEKSAFRLSKNIFGSLFCTSKRFPFQ